MENLTSYAKGQDCKYPENEVETYLYHIEAFKSDYGQDSRHTTDRPQSTLTLSYSICRNYCIIIWGVSW